MDEDFNEAIGKAIGGARQKDGRQDDLEGSVQLADEERLHPQRSGHSGIDQSSADDQQIAEDDQDYQPARDDARIA